MNAPAAPKSAAPPPSVLRRLGRPFAALAAVAVPTLYVAAVDPNAPGHYPSCPVLRATGWWCPGCGGLRAVHALAHGDLTTAGHDNLLVLALAGVVGVLWLRWFWAGLHHQRPADRRPGPGAGGLHDLPKPPGRGGAGSALDQLSPLLHSGSLSVADRLPKGDEGAEKCPNGVHTGPIFETRAGPMRYAPPAPDTIEGLTGASRHRIITGLCEPHPST